MINKLHYSNFFYCKLTILSYIILQLYNENCHHQSLESFLKSYNITELHYIFVLYFVFKYNY